MTSTGNADTDCSSEASYTCYTPTETIFSETMRQPAAAVASSSSQVEYPPQVGKTFIIRSHDERHLVLELLDNKLRVASMDEAGLGITWRCIKTFGWYGFTNTVSGGHLGHDGEMNMRGCVVFHGEWEYFTIDRHKDGGYVLLVAIEGVLHEIKIAEDGASLDITRGGGQAWDFIEVSTAGVPNVFLGACA